jgi:hypothetical protein
MPKPLDLPEDLLDLDRTARDAEHAMETTRDGDVEPARQDYLAAAAAIYAHPTLAAGPRRGALLRADLAGLARPGEAAALAEPATAA